jgi:hypothetical protein
VGAFLCVCDRAAIFDEGQDAKARFPFGLADGAELAGEIVDLAAAVNKMVGLTVVSQLVVPARFVPFALSIAPCGPS